MEKLPKSLRVSEIRHLMGDEAADKILTVFLRKKASVLIRISTDDIDAVERLLDDAQHRRKADLCTLGRVTLKWLTESKSGRSRAALKNYLLSLKKATANAERVSRPKGRRRRGRPPKAAGRTPLL